MRASFLLAFLLPLCSAAPTPFDAKLKHHGNNTRDDKIFENSEIHMGDLTVDTATGDNMQIGHTLDINVVQSHGVHSVKENADDSHGNAAPTHSQDGDFEERLSSLFKSMDTDDDGIISVAELIRICNENDIYITELEAQNVLTYPSEAVPFTLSYFLAILENAASSSDTGDLIHFLFRSSGSQDHLMFDKNLMHVFLAMDADHDCMIFVPDVLSVFQDMGKTVSLDEAKSLLSGYHGHNHHDGVDFKLWKKLILGEVFKRDEHLADYWRHAFIHVKENFDVELTDDDVMRTDVKNAAKTAVKALKHGTEFGECYQGELVKVEGATVEVKEGLLYKLQLRISTMGGEDCMESREMICENILMTKPLPKECRGTEALKLLNREHITCQIVGSTTTSSTTTSKEFPEIAATFSAMDTDGDGKITRDQFKQFMLYVDKVSFMTSALASNSDVSEDVLIDMYMANADTDGNMYVAMADTDGDGMVSLEEFINFVEKDSDKEGAFNTFVKAFDKDGSGALNVAEYTEFDEQIMGGQSRGMVGLVVEMMDQDGDGEVNAKELEAIPSPSVSTTPSPPVSSTAYLTQAYPTTAYPTNTYPLYSKDPLWRETTVAPPATTDDYPGASDFATAQDCTVTGKSCIFPFIYNGVTYNKCTNTDSVKEWCATNVDNNGEVDRNTWEDCAEECPETERDSDGAWSTTVAPSATTVAPSATTVAPSATTVAPSSTTVAPSSTTSAYPMGCNNLIEKMASYSPDFIESENFGTGSYPPNKIDCWMIIWPQGKQLRLNFDPLFRLEEGTSTSRSTTSTSLTCKYDYLHMYSYPLDEKFCGVIAPTDLVVDSYSISHSNSLLVKFATDEDNLNGCEGTCYGFRMNFVTVDEPTTTASPTTAGSTTASPTTAAYPTTASPLYSKEWSEVTEKHWSGAECPNLSVDTTSLEECKKNCEDLQTCTAINYVPSTSKCVLKACPIPVPAPQTYDADYKGYFLLDYLH